MAAGVADTSSNQACLPSQATCSSSSRCCGPLQVRLGAGQPWSTALYAPAGDSSWLPVGCGSRSCGSVEVVALSQDFYTPLPPGPTAAPAIISVTGPDLDGQGLVLLVGKAFINSDFVNLFIESLTPLLAAAAGRNESSLVWVPTGLLLPSVAPAGTPSPSGSPSIPSSTSPGNPVPGGMVAIWLQVGRAWKSGVNVTIMVGNLVATARDGLPRSAPFCHAGVQRLRAGPGVWGGAFEVGVGCGTSGGVDNTTAVVLVVVMTFYGLVALLLGGMYSLPASRDIRKHIHTAYLLWLIFGFFGLHRFYLNHTRSGLLYALTGGLFGIGWLVDICLIPSLMQDCERLRERRIATVFDSIETPARPESTIQPTIPPVARTVLPARPAYDIPALYVSRQQAVQRFHSPKDANGEDMTTLLEVSRLMSQHVEVSPILNPALTAHLRTRGIDLARSQARAFVQGPTNTATEFESRPPPDMPAGPAANTASRNPEGMHGWS